MSHENSPHEKIAKILEELRPYALGLAERDADLANDVLQEAALKCFSKIEQLQDPDAATAWVAAIVRNCFHDRWRSPHSRELQLDAGMELSVESDAWFNKYDREHATKTVHSMLAAFPGQPGDVVRLVVACGGELEAAHRLIEGTHDSFPSYDNLEKANKYIRANVTRFKMEVREACKRGEAPDWWMLAVPLLLAFFGRNTKATATESNNTVRGPQLQQPKFTTQDELRGEGFGLSAAVARVRWEDVKLYEGSAYVAIAATGAIVGDGNSVPYLVQRVRNEKGQDFVFTTASVKQFKDCR